MPQGRTSIGSKWKKALERCRKHFNIINNICEQNLLYQNQVVCLSVFDSFAFVVSEVSLSIKAVWTLDSLTLGHSCSRPQCMD
jgi:hypothetical protein